MNNKYLDFVLVPAFVIALFIAVMHKAEKIREESQVSPSPLKEFVIK